MRSSLAAMGVGEAQEPSEGWALVADAVRARLKELRLTQMEAASRAGVSLATIQELVQGLPRRRQPRTLAAVSAALGWPAEHLSLLLASDAQSESAKELLESPISLDEVDREIRAIRKELDRINRRLAALEAETPEGEH